MRFFDQMERMMKSRLYRERVGPTEMWLELALRNEHLKRVSFDSRQAATFWATQESPPVNVQTSLQTPFEMFYLEFTQPILVSDPVHQDNDIYLRAIFASTLGILPPELPQICLLYTSPSPRDS